MSDKKVISGSLLLFAGFYVMLQKAEGVLIIGLALMFIGLYLILSNIK